jgi:trans-2,3-dihydro-3-hydroxyanthranilate isomerase
MPDRRYRFYTADVFTNQAFSGNPLAVFPDAEDLTTHEMQRIANELNLSETVFVLPPQEAQHTKRLRIFTPHHELPFAGHPTVGTAVVLASTGEIPGDAPETSVIFEEGVGPIPIAIRRAAGQATYAQFSVAQLPAFGPPAPPPEAVAAALSLTVDDLDLHTTPIQTASCGVPFMYVPVRHLAAVERIRVNQTALHQLPKNDWTSHLYVYTRETATPDADVHARMFAPALGVGEDPATGSAASSLAGVLALTATQSSGTLRWRIEQGLEIQRPSLIDVEADMQDGVITAVRVGGQAVLISQGEMFVGQSINPSNAQA